MDDPCEKIMVKLEFSRSDIYDCAPGYSDEHHQAAFLPRMLGPGASVPDDVEIRRHVEHLRLQKLLVDVLRWTLFCEEWLRKVRLEIGKVEPDSFTEHKPKTLDYDPSMSEEEREVARDSLGYLTVIVRRFLRNKRIGHHGHSLVRGMDIEGWTPESAFVVLGSFDVGVRPPFTTRDWLSRHVGPIEAELLEIKTRAARGASSARRL